MRLIAKVAAVAAMAVFASGASAQTPTPVSKMAAPGGERSIGWTPERMANAKPGAKLTINAATVKALQKRAAMNRSAPVVYSSSEAAKGPRPPKPPKPGDTFYDKPLSFAGKLFYSTSEGDFFCSAQFISPHVVLTAASCVQSSEGVWYENLVFAAQYKNGKSVAEFKDKCAATLTTWAKPRDGEDPYFYDYATILIDGEAPAGHFGVAINWDSYDKATVVGYANGVAKGEVLQAFTGPLSDSDEGFVGLTHNRKEDLVGIGGGAFIANFSATGESGGGGSGGGGTGGGSGGTTGGGGAGGSGGGAGGSGGGAGGTTGGGTTGGAGGTTDSVALGAPKAGGPPAADANVVISLDSFNYTDQPSIDFGPYLDDDFKMLWDYTEKGCQ